MIYRTLAEAIEGKLEDELRFEAETTEEQIRATVIASYLSDLQHETHNRERLQQGLLVAIEELHATRILREANKFRMARALLETINSRTTSKDITETLNWAKRILFQIDEELNPRRNQ